MNFDKLGHVIIIFIAFIIVAIGFFRINDGEVPSTILLFLSLAALLFTLGDIFKSFPKTEKAYPPLVLFGVIATLMGLVIPIFWKNADDFSSVIDGFALISLATIILSFGIKAMNEKTN